VSIATSYMLSPGFHIPNTDSGHRHIILALLPSLTTFLSATNGSTHSEIYNSVDLDSNHRILSTYIKVSLQTTKGKPCSRNKFNWKRLAEVKNEFQLKLANRFAALTEIETISDRYNYFESATRSAAAKVIGIRTTNGLPNWVSRTTDDLRNTRDIAKRKHLSHKMPFTRKRRKDLSIELNTSYYQIDEINHLEKQLDALNFCRRKKRDQ